MKFSKFGQKFTGSSGVLQLMDDLGQALTAGQKLIMLGGGNPAHIPAVQQHFRQRMQTILDDNAQYEQMIGNYGPPQGDYPLAEALAALFRREYGWDISAKNIALTNGSQTTFFYLFNILAGAFDDGSHKKILLPLAPEYIGYLDVGLTEDLFVASKPEIEYLGNHLFKYHVNFDAVTVTDEIGAICVSRPTNPTGNVLTNAELNKLRDLARQHDIPLIIDNAYGLPFPNIVFAEAAPLWDEQIIMCMSLSKLGLPGSRTGIVIASERITAAISALNAVISLAPGAIGAWLVHDLLRSGEIMRLSRDLIRPFYQRKADQAVAQLQQEMGEVDDFYIHKPEGAFFLWLWFKNLPLTSQQFYERLKQRGVVVVPGEYFFPGIKDPWPHKYECIRVSYAGKDEDVRAGLSLIAEEAKRAYDS